MRVRLQQRETTTTTTISIEQPAPGAGIVDEEKLRSSCRPFSISSRFILLIVLVIATNRGIHHRATAANYHFYYSLKQDATVLRGLQDKEEHVKAADMHGASTQQQPKDRAAIVGLASNRPQDVNDFCIALKSLANLPDVQVNATLADVVIFHDNLSTEQQETLRNCTTANRQVLFPLLEYSFGKYFPDGFDPVAEQPHWRKRTKWGYHQMIRFWITFVWQHPAVQPYTTLMRLDSDACWIHHPKKTIPPHLPRLPTETNVVYHANKRKHDALKVSQGFGVFVRDYVEQRGIVPQNPELFAALPNEHNQPSPMFSNNFEVVRLDFMQRPDVQQFHQAMTEQEPFGVFRYRWGDALARYAAIALFATPEELIESVPEGYLHGRAARSVCS